MNEETKQVGPNNFSVLGITPALLRVLDNNNISEPTPIQNQTIPKGLEGKDIVGIAQTGTGKTLAFGLPMLQRLASGKGRGLIVVPTRELAYQAQESLQPYASIVGIKTAVFVGGSPMYLQKRMLKNNPRILIATPGRLNDHLQQRTVSLKEVSVLVLDEADRMLDMGFKPQINKILQHVPRDRQTLLFSATMPQSIFTIAKKEMKLPLRIEVAPAGTAAKDIEQELIIVRKENKKDLLISLLKEIEGSVLVFSRTKHGAKNLTRQLNTNRFTAAEIHSNKTLSQRREALAGFKSGKYRVLVATDIAARGIDVTNISVVINHDLPDDPSDYVHRIGRTGRAGKSGKAISFAMPSQMKDVKNIEGLINSSLRRISIPTLPKESFEFTKSTNSRNRRRPSRRSGSRSGFSSNRNNSQGGFSSERSSSKGGFSSKRNSSSSSSNRSSGAPKRNDRSGSAPKRRRRR
ncbi:DEAD/DEAH box helicase [Candidatus Peregrinibacteria bacterium]|jgi:ATP-dependent RNA helicase RhlE|nr:DEAD/DEAH box helicase [Candidatus Peregrinibacteria bacterium]MBT3598478.1 DEAD/DEAH box helicase [Candidatus Peregrinibacteria bacterium]MBT4366997.1 DEAD/DEAH box helicase [Candidatus Peregrinibacteria bacterium]MBT4586008.1 DEAD/DEAH box helicase [Candidatus Peregrinibacteria bacterium]MBT6730853.1 DEAD/DEAH box helicase [Candidatus Peregrinibacteria bacterium]